MSRVKEQLGAQEEGEFFRSAKRNIFIVITLVRILAIFFLYLLLFNIWSILDPGVKETSNLRALFTLFVLFFFVIIVALLTIATLIVSPVANTLTPGMADQYFISARAFIFNTLFGEIRVDDLTPGRAGEIDANIFLGSSGNNDPLGPMSYLINKHQRIDYVTPTLDGMILLSLVLIFIAGIGFIRKSSVSLAGLTLVISQLVIGLAIMKDRVTSDLTAADALKPDGIGEMFTSPLFQLAFISYLYFEFSLQTGYLYSLTNPTLTRQQRVGKQLSRLSEFRLGVTKLGTEDEKAADQAQKEQKEADDKEDHEEKVSVSLSTGADSSTAKHFTSDALVFLLDSAQDSLFAKPGGEQERLTGRLQRYHDGLLAHDSKLDTKLGGSAGKAFNPFIVFFVVISSMIFRIIILVIFANLVLNPETLIDQIALPETIKESIEIGEPEGTLIVLIPAIFFILGISYLISRIQTWIVKAEEVIIRESDIGKLLRAGKTITSRKDVEKVEKVLAGEVGREVSAQEVAGETATQRTETEGQPRRRRRRRRRPKQ